jgi:hypothetical protein
MHFDTHASQETCPLGLPGVCPERAKQTSPAAVFDVKFFMMIF